MQLLDIFKSGKRFIDNQWKFILSFFLLGIVIGYLYDSVKEPYYETNAIATSGISFFEGVVDHEELWVPIIDQKVAIDIINSLGHVVEKREISFVSEKLAISEEVAKDLVFLEAEQLYDLDLENRRQKLSHFKITMRVLNNSSIEEIQDGLYHFFNHNHYALKSFNLFKGQMPAMISQIDVEIVALKSSRDGTNQSKESNTISIANNRSEVFQNQIIQLFEYKQTMERNMMLFEPISFLTEFPVYTTPKGRTSFRLVLLGFVFLLFGCFLAFVKELKKMG